MASCCLPGSLVAGSLPFLSLFLSFSFSLTCLFSLVQFGTAGDSVRVPACRGLSFGLWREKERPTARERKEAAAIPLTICDLGSEMTREYEGTEWKASHARPTCIMGRIEGTPLTGPFLLLLLLSTNSHDLSPTLTGTLPPAWLVLLTLFLSLSLSLSHYHYETMSCSCCCSFVKWVSPHQVWLSSVPGKGVLLSSLLSSLFDQRKVTCNL